MRSGYVLKMSNKYDQRTEITVCRKKTEEVERKVNKFQGQRMAW